MHGKSRLRLMSYLALFKLAAAAVTLMAVCCSGCASSPAQQQQHSSSMGNVRMAHGGEKKHTCV